MRICEVCGKTYPDGIQRCPSDEQVLLDANDERVGTRVDRYVILKLIGKGARGDVYLAVHPMIGSRVAVKIMHNAAPRDSEEFHRFVMEAQAVNRVEHPNIVRVMDMATLPDERPYILMEYLEGTTLRDRMLREPLLEPAEAASIVTQVVSALGAAHDAGFIHRDLKPENVFLTRKGPVKLLDFGIAKLIDENNPKPLTKTGTVVGTPMYLAPEQALGRTSAVGPWTDLYSMGVILYEMYVGRSPFEGENVSSILMAHIEEAPPAPSALNERIPQELERVILWCLEKNPGDRPQQAGELAHALEKALAAYAVAAGDAPLPRFRSPELADVDEGVAPEGPSRKRATPGARRSSPGAFGERRKRFLTVTDLFKGSARRDRLSARRNATRRGILYAVVALLVLASAGLILWGVRAGSDEQHSLAPAASHSPKASTRDDDAAASPLVVLQPRPIPSLDPNRAFTTEAINLVQQTHETLVDYDLLTGTVKPRLARAWSRGRGRVTFTLRSGVRFHDGSLLTAEVAAQSLQRTLRSPVGKATLWDVKAVKARGTDELIVTLNEPSATFLMRMSLHTAAISRPGKPYPLGTGPYRVRSWNKQLGAIVLEAHAGYWSHRPRIHSWVIRSQADPEAAASLLTQGDAHVIADVPLHVAVRLRKQPELQVLRAPARGTSYLTYNNRRTELASAAVRRAISEAIDRRTLVDRVYYGSASLAEGTLPPDLAGPRRKPRIGARYAPKKARKALAGKPVTKRALTLLVPTDTPTTLPAPRIFAGLIKANLAAAGLRVKVVFLPVAELVHRAARGDNDLAIMAWSPDYPDPENIFFILSHQGAVAGLNLTHFADPAFEKRLHRARMERDPARRQKQLSRLEALVARKHPWLPIAHIPSFLVKRREVRGLRYAVSVNALFSLGSAWVAPHH